jgi:hypothetical protein
MFNKRKKKNICQEEIRESQNNKYYKILFLWDMENCKTQKQKVEWMLPRKGKRRTI